jgi:TolA-binding protein
VLLAVISTAGAAGWGPYNAWNVQRTIGVPKADPKQPKMRGMDCCTVAFPTHGAMQPDGRDLRVALGSEAAPFQIVDIAPHGVVRIVVGLRTETDRFYVYYGNPAAKKLETSWQPRRGLWLETREFAGGTAKSAATLKALAERSGPRFGRGPVGAIHHGHNPFGPSQQYVSIYDGWLVLPKEGKVRFAVSADDAAALFVGGNEAAAKLDWGPMPRNKRYAGAPLLLEAGIHPVRLVHVQRDGRSIASAAWWMEGMRRGKKYLHYQVIPSKAFAPVRHGTLLNVQHKGKLVAADMSASNEGDVLLDGKDMLVRYVFRDTSRPADRALKCSPHWDFGDGTTSDARDPSHVYLRPGDYTVSLSLTRGDSVFRVAQKVRVGPGWHRAAERQWDKLEFYHPILRDYQFEKMATEDLVVLARAFEQLENDGVIEKAAATDEEEGNDRRSNEVMAVCQELYRRGDKLDDKTFVRHCLLLGRRLREVEGKAKEALSVFARAEARTKDVHDKARLANEQGDVYYYFLDDLERAEQQYARTLTKHVKAADAQVRVAQMRIGDLYRTKGDYAAALKAYGRAAEMPIHNRPEGVQTARRGAFPRTAEDYTRRKLFKEAHQALNDWEWEFPTDKLVGHCSLLRARLAMAEGNPEEAIKQAEEILRANRESEYADDLLLFLADVYREEGRLDDAADSVSRLLDGYPASALQEPARLVQAELLMLQGKHGKAATKALALAGDCEGSETAPKALLLAASAQAKDKKTADAIRTLESLTRKYQDAEETARAIEMLKELRQK